MKQTLFFLLFFLPAMALAQSGSGADLRNSGTDYLRVCESMAPGQATARPAVCNVWMTGVVDGLQAYNANMKVLPLFDAPDINVGQVMKLVAKYINDHPSNAKLPTAALVLAALMDAYPKK
jgi:hypothetical protein